MRIVHLQHPYIPGRGYQENYLPYKQSELGHDVHIITTDIIPEKFEGQSGDFIPGTYEYKGIPTHRCKSITYDTEAATLPLGAREKIRDLDPDVIHSHRLISLLSLVSLSSNICSRSKMVFDLHVDNGNFHLDRLYKKIGFGLFRRLALPLLKMQSDAFLAVNPYAQRFLQEKLGINNSYLLPLGVDTEEFYPSSEERKQVRTNLGLEEEFLIITAGNLTRNKKIEQVIKSIPLLDDSVRLLILGEGPDDYLNELYDIVEELSIQNQVLFKDFVDHSSLSMYYNAADLGIWPGKLGITILEAVGCGLPIIVDNSEATGFAIQNDNGFGLEETNSETISNTISTYLNDPSLQSTHRQNALELVQTTLSWDAIARKSIRIYDSI